MTIFVPTRPASLHGESRAQSLKVYCEIVKFLEGLDGRKRYSFDKEVRSRFEGKSFPDSMLTVTHAKMNYYYWALRDSGFIEAGTDNDTFRVLKKNVKLWLEQYPNFETLWKRNFAR